jgi:hypothetical protein
MPVTDTAPAGNPVPALICGWAAGAPESDAFHGRPSLFVTADRYAAAGPSLSERGLANRDQQVRMPHLSGKYVVLVLEPGKLGFQVTYSLLQAAHL